jgi:D-beta-D-heptose 7-phosphate kinase/D-beta-D-heptose 1-phosphate adenosyltransferase
MSQLKHPRDKVVAEHLLIRKLGRPREQRLVFTNGVFDILHRGHVEYLFAARELGDALVVAVNTDASVRRLKGHDRPINADGDRAMVLAGLGCVDYVTFFADDTPRGLISALLPDVLVKGGDYTPATIVGRDEVEAAGGRVVVIPFLAGRSTTQTVQKIRGSE